MRELLRLLRLHQWIKNFFVLAGLFFGHAWNDSALVISVIFSFIAFCFISSTAYIYNDMIDCTQDRVHPVKKYRPLACQTISMRMAMVTAVLLFLAALGLGLMVSYKTAVILLSYFCLNIAYTHFFKYRVILDVFAISAGFMLRILAGTLGVNIPPSPWLLFCGLMMTLFLGFAKRLAEKKALQETDFLSREILKTYQTVFLDKMISITATCTIVGYGLYTLSTETVRYHHTLHLIYTLPFVIYGIFRYIYLLDNQGGEDTAKDIVKDRPLMVTVLIWGLVTFCIIA